MTEKSPELKVFGSIIVCEDEDGELLVLEFGCVFVAFASKLETELDVWLVGPDGEGLGVGCVVFALGLFAFVLK